MLIQILKILGIIILVILALVLILLHIPRTFWVEFDKADLLTVKARILFFKVKVYRMKKEEKEEGRKKASGPGREKKKKAPAPKKDEKPRKEKKKITDDLRFSFDLVSQVLDTATEGMRRILRGIRIRDLSFTLPVGGKDANTVRLATGAATAAFYNLNTVASRILDLEYGSPKIIPDFSGTLGDSLYFYVKIIASPIRLAAGGIWMALKGLRILKTHKKEPAPRDDREAA